MRKAGAVVLATLILGVLGWKFGPMLADQAMRWLYPRQYSQVVSREAQEFALEEELVYAVIRAESGFDREAHSHAGAKGLMQLTEPTFEWMTVEYPPENGGVDMFDVNDNIHCGCALLRRLLDHYGRLEVALAAYNAGIGNVDRWLEEGEHSKDGETLDSIPFPETAAYVKKVLRNRRVYLRLYG